MPMASNCSLNRVTLREMSWPVLRWTPCGHFAVRYPATLGDGLRRGATRGLGQKRLGECKGVMNSQRIRARLANRRIGLRAAADLLPFAPLRDSGGHGRGMAQSGSASALGAEGRGFESLCPDHIQKRAGNLE